jgi:transcriptional regulator with XRE-family HTH domain
MTQTDFASRIGVSQSYLSAAEHGRYEVAAEVLLAISREFDPEAFAEACRAFYEKHGAVS